MNRVYSDFALEELGVKFVDGTGYQSADCVGSCEEAMESKTVTKKCRGVVAKTRSRGTGAGTLKLVAHIPWAIYTNAYGMELDDLVSGVKAYGRNSVHKEFSIVMRIEDEDGIEKLKAYPKCIITTGVTRKIENGAEEVAEIELEISVMPDEYGNGVYECIVDELEDGSEVATTWMTDFTPALVRVSKA